MFDFFLSNWNCTITFGNHCIFLPWQLLKTRFATFSDFCFHSILIFKKSKVQLNSEFLVQSHKCSQKFKITKQNLSSAVKIVPKNVLIWCKNSGWIVLSFGWKKFQHNISKPLLRIINQSHSKKYVDNQVLKCVWIFSWIHTTFIHLKFTWN